MKIIPQFEPSFGHEEQQAVYDYMGSGAWLTENKRTEEFERHMASFLGCRHMSCVNNGTISLSLALLAAGLKSGDQVIVPDITMIATATASKFVGIEPIFVDVDPKNLCLDLEKALATIKSNPLIRGVLYVSLNGRSHSAKEIEAFRKRCPGIAFIEDAAQSFGSKEESGSYLGTLGDVGSFSFSPHKILSTGQGGALASFTPEMYEKIERLKDFGRLAGGGDIHEHFGINSKFTDLQSVIGMEQLKKVPDRMASKRFIYKQYHQWLSGIPGIEMFPLPDHTVPWFVDVYVDRKTELIAHLDRRGIKTRPIYQALHTQRVFGPWNAHNEFAVSDSYGRCGLWLPSSVNLSIADIDEVCRAIQGFYLGSA